MTEGKHTPEPWVIEDRTEIGEGYSIVSESAHYSAAGVAHYVSHRDARLIAAAPDLLAALVDLYTFVSGPHVSVPDTEYRKVMNAASAIAKTEGR